MSLKTFLFGQEKPQEKKKSNADISIGDGPIVERRELKSKLIQKMEKMFELPSELTQQLVTTGMDEGLIGMKARLNNANDIPFNVLSWYSAQSNIGYTMAAIFSQHWLVDKACSMPGEDAIRKGWDITANSGDEVSSDKLDALRQFDKERDINSQMVEMIRLSRIFGLRLVMFDIASGDALYYQKPFNIDGIKKGSYKGVIQIDPNWVQPELVGESMADPTSPDFYEPMYWIIGKKRIHKSHLIIVKPNEVPDILKPAYRFGGISIPQKIYERVYAAERTANESPMLALTKRTTTLRTDIEQAMSNQSAFEERMAWWVAMRDNDGIKVIGTDEAIEQLDTNLTGLDDITMMQYLLVSSIAEVPVTKLMGTQPKGLGATGEYDESSYHEKLESIQSHQLTPFLNRHHEISIRHLGMDFSVSVKWTPLDSPTTKEVADTNYTKSQTAANWSSIGAIDANDARNFIIADADSGYNGLEKRDMTLEDEGNDDETDQETDAPPASEE